MEWESPRAGFEEHHLSHELAMNQCITVLGLPSNDADLSTTPTGTSFSSLNPLSSDMHMDHDRDISEFSLMYLDVDMESPDLDGLSMSPVSNFTTDYGFHNSVALSDQQASVYQYNQTINAYNTTPTSSHYAPRRKARPHVDVHQASHHSVSVPAPVQISHPSRPTVSTNCSRATRANEDPTHHGYENLYTQQPPRNDPWSAEGHSRYPGDPGGDMPLFGPESDNIDYYNNTGNAWDSPNSFNFIRTPSSVGSPQHPPSIPFVTPQSQSQPTQHQTLPFRYSLEHQSLEQSVPLEVIDESEYVTNQASQQPPYHIANPTMNFAEASNPPYAQIHAPLTVDHISLANSTISSAAASAGTLSPRSSSEASRGPIIVQHFFSPSPSESSSRTAKRNQARTSKGKRHGGRPLGSHLEPRKAAETKVMRDEGSCWLCCLQRDKCTPGRICARCNKRTSKPQSDHGLGCDRTKLSELKEYFLPHMMTSIHDLQALKEFGHQHIKTFFGKKVIIQLGCGQGRLPLLDCEVYEFQPNTPELLRQFQYVTDPDTGKRIRQEKYSPPLAMSMVDDKDQRRYDRYLNEIVDRYLGAFAQICFAEETNAFQTDLLTLMCNLYRDGTDEEKLLKEILRLVVVTYIMGHTLSMPDGTKENTLRHLQNYAPGAYAKFCSPRMASRQLKYLFCALHQVIMHNVLAKLQQILRSSNRKGSKLNWASAFCAVLGFAMVHEITQKTIHMITDANFAQGKISEREAERQAESACRAIDDRFGFIMTLFRWKYNRTFNPFCDFDQSRLEGMLGDRSMQFVRDVHVLVLGNHDYLYERQYIGISTDNQARYTSRLVARFLLSFWNPS